MSLARPALFLDRDGVINVDTGYPHDPAALRLTPNAAAGIRLANDAGAWVLVVTNQSGVARGLFPLAAVDAFHAAIQARIDAACGARIDAFYVCPFHRDGIVPEFTREHEDRKPAPGLLLRAMRDRPVDRARSLMIGDKPSDAEAAARAGVRSVLIPSDIGDLAAAVRDWLAARSASEEPMFGSLS